MGWSNYLTFGLSAINTMTVTYYLAIEKASSINFLFPSFTHYIILTTSIGIPLLIAIGYFHFKKSNAYKAEADISYESNPHLKRILQNTETILPLYLKMTETIIKMSKNEKLTEKEIDEISKLQNNLSEHIHKRITGEYESNVYDSDSK